MNIILTLSTIDLGLYINFLSEASLKIMSTEHTISISFYQGLLKRREISPFELVEYYLNQIKKKDNEVRSWARVVGDFALSEARKLTDDSRYRSLPLYGIPFGAKDLFLTKGIKTEAGCKLYKNFIPSQNATVIERLQEAGAILLGKTTMTELATKYLPPTTRNPWNLEHTPGGSSSGSAAALASDMALFSLGTQTRGSLLRPAAYNGLTCLKATFGRISRYGVIPCSRTFDHVGAMTHSVADTVIIYNIISGYDRNDITTKNILTQKLKIQKINTRNYKIGVLIGDFFNNSDSIIIKKMNEAILKLKSIGFEIKFITFPNYVKFVLKAHDTIEYADFAAYNQKHFNNNPNLYSSGLQSMIGSSLNISAIDYINAQNIRLSFKSKLHQLFEENRVDVLLCPTTPTLAPKGLMRNGSPKYNIPFTNAGIPSLTLPIGFDEKTNLPIGMQIIAPDFEEQKAIDVGYMYQLVTNWHKRKLIAHSS
jgi:Asp-tRNAAsn/Glu-tRNAGln amidotransferase A subunit and related amidases